MALNKVKGNLQRIFDKNLADLIRGIRNNKENEARYIAQCMEEIKQELKQDNLSVKANAIAKLAYLQMYGYDISWAAFNIIEVMASTKFTEKRVGYVTASQSFQESTDVLMLTTNMIRKDLNSTQMYEAGVALSGLACFVSPDLARDLANDVVTLLTSSRPYIRKKAVLLLYKVFLKYPDALRPTFPRLKEKLEDPDPGVQSAAVNVICELARKNPKNYLSLAPVFFKLMTTSTNNWMLIKIIKLFGALVPLEPRLGKKLLDPLTNLINSTSAMSLLYECINTVIAVLISVSSGAPGDHTASIQLCVQKLGVLIEDTDQNLKYLGLLAMGKILQTHPKAVQAHKDIVLMCLDDKDESIRLRALDLLYGMVSKKNIMEIVKKLMEHVDGAEGSNYRDELLSRIISICSHNNYQYITNFEWYVSVLVELTKVEGTRHGALIASQMLDVAVRVHSIRHLAVSQMALLIENAHLLLAGSVQQRSNVSEVLLAAAWICGEYSEHLRNGQSVFEAMLRTKVSLMPGHIQSTFVQNIAKLYAVRVTEAEKEDDWDLIASLDNLMLSKLPQFEQTDHLEAQERACSLIELIRKIEDIHNNREKVAEFVSILFEGELNPIAPKAQRKVPVPQGLDLDAWINECPVQSSSSESEPEMPTDRVRSEFVGFGQQINFGAEAEARKTYEPTKDELKKQREAREAQQRDDPHYLKGPAVEAPKKKRPNKLSKRMSSEDSSSTTGRLAENTPLDLQSPLEIPGFDTFSTSGTTADIAGVVGLDKYMEQQQKTLSWKKAKKDKKKRRKGRKVTVSSSEDEVPVVHEVNRDMGEMPDDAKSTDDEEQIKHIQQNGDFRALDMDLDVPLREDERLPVPQHRVVSPDQEGEQPQLKPKKKKKKKEAVEKKTKKSKKHKVKEAEPEPQVNNTPTVLSDVNALQNDLESWLLDGKKNEKPVIEEEQKEPQNQHKKKGKSKSGGERRKKGKKEKHHKEDALIAGDSSQSYLQVRDKSDYEVASGVCTPSKQPDSSNPETPQRPSESPGPQTPEMSSYHVLAENQHLRMTYETRVSTADAHQVAVAVVFANLTSTTIRNLEFNVLDSLNTKMLRETPGSAVAVPFTLLEGLANEHEFRFSVSAINVSQRLRGTLTFMRESEDGAVPEKLDFSLRLQCVTFTLPATISREAFAELLSGGELASKSSISFRCTESIQTLIALICFHAHFTVVEQVGATASLYTQTIQAQPVCLLLKIQGDKVNLDAKSSDNSLVSNIVDEVKELCVNQRI